jgi:hypothetical protein
MSVRFEGSAAATADASPHNLNLRWALRRALLGLVILTVGVGGMAWLTHASIDQAQERAIVGAAR